MRLRALASIAALALGACAAQAQAPTQSAASQCLAEMALYRHRTQPDATLRILPTPHPLNAYSELAARVDFEGDTYWFAFVSSLGYSMNYIGRTEDPFESAAREDSGQAEEYAEPDYNGSELTLFDADYNVIENVPDRGQPAPAHILANGVASSIWYSIPRRSLDRQLWDFSECVDDLG